jgi:hypothetical protein
MWVEIMANCVGLFWSGMQRCKRFTFIEYLDSLNLKRACNFVGHQVVLRLHFNDVVSAWVSIVVSEHIVEFGLTVVSVYPR